jgi:HPr kinase/phosphorylase
LRNSSIAASNYLSNDQETASEISSEAAGIVAVRDLMTDSLLGLDFELLQGREGLDNLILSPRIQKLGMTLAGFAGYIHPDRVQVAGGSELNYLWGLEPEARLKAINRLRNHKICCILVTKSLEIPEELSRIAGEEKIPVLRSSVPSSVSIAKLASYLERKLAPRITIHGVLIEIFGLGVLIMGPSGIGKSECALELILKGHRLITDDYVELTRLSLDRLSGAGGRVLKHHMELRGLGIINIKELFGISATRMSQNVDIAVRLEHWNSEEDYDRLGLDHSTIEYLGVSIPLVTMPVAPGRNIAALVEVAARIHLLRQRGYRPLVESDDE